MARSSTINVPCARSGCTVRMVCQQGKIPLTINIRTIDDGCSLSINMSSAKRKLSLKSSCKILNLRRSCCLLLLLLRLLTLSSIVPHLLTSKALHSAQILLLPILLLGPTLLVLFFPLCCQCHILLILPTSRTTALQKTPSSLLLNKVITYPVP